MFEYSAGANAISLFSTSFKNVIEFVIEFAWIELVTICSKRGWMYFSLFSWWSPGCCSSPHLYLSVVSCHRCFLVLLSRRSIPHYSSAPLHPSLAASPKFKETTASKRPWIQIKLIEWMPPRYCLWFKHPLLLRTNIMHSNHSQTHFSSFTICLSSHCPFNCIAIRRMKCAEVNWKLQKCLHSFEFDYHRLLIMFGLDFYSAIQA